MLAPSPVPASPRPDLSALAIDYLRLTCQRCGHEWLRRRLTPPAVCPRCKSRLWDVPREKKKEHVA